MTTETITIPKKEYKELKRDAELLKNLHLYKRLMEFERNIAAGKRFSRSDLGF